MALEQVIEANTEAMKALTAALLSGQRPATGGGKGGGGAGKATEPEHSFEEVTKICVRVKNEKGEDAAKDLIKTVGKAESLKKVAKENFDALFDAATAKLAEDDEL
jgi:hypothetical protein